MMDQQGGVYVFVNKAELTKLIPFWGIVFALRKVRK
jgi:hypothetical protein